MTSEAGSGNGQSVFVVKSWQTVLLVLVQLVAMAMSYASLKAQSEENERRIRELEQKPMVLEPENQRWRDETTRRLERLEEKIDRAARH